MRKLGQRQRLAVVLSGFMAVIPSAVFAVKNGHVNRALLIGVLCGILAGLPLLILKRHRGLGSGY